LERIRHYLKGLQSESGLSSLDSSGYRSWSEPIPTTNLEVSSGQFTSGQLMESANSPQAALMLSQQMMQAFTQDLAQLRSSLLQPLHSETVRLQQQRDSLLQEIRQLERQRQQHTLIQQRASQEQQVYDFLQGLMDRLQERLSQQINQVVGTLAAQAKMGDSSLVLEGQGSALFPQEAGLPPLPPAQRVEQLQMLQARADQVMMTLDTTLRAFAEALQQNIQSYESSLSQGLEKMHSMGQQGEAIVANLVQKLADQVSGQVLSGTLPSLPASPGSRLQGFNVQNTSLPVPGTATGAPSTGGLSAGQQFASYTSPDSNDRTSSRFGVPLSRSAKPSTVGNSPTSGKTIPNPVADPVVTQPATKASKESAADRNADGNPPLDLELDLLEKLEQTTVDAEAQAETQVGNEELDAFYASLFGDTPRKLEPLDLKLDAELDAELAEEADANADTQLEFESEVEGELESELDLSLDSELEAPEPEPATLSDFASADSVGEDETIALAEDLNDVLARDVLEGDVLEGDSAIGGEAVESSTLERSPFSESDDLETDPFADLGAGLEDDDEALDLELLDDVEPESPAGVATSGEPTAGVTTSAAPDSASEPPQESAQTIGIATGGAMDPLAALSLELQVPFQGVTELSPQRPGAVPESSPSEDSLTDPLMADLEEALQSFGSPPSSPSSPEVTTTLTGEPSPQIPSSQAIPPEDVITTLADVLPAWDAVNVLQRAQVSLTPTPPPVSVPEKPPEADLEDEVYHLAPPEEPLLVQDDAEEGTQIDLHLEPETLQQLTEDLSNLERMPPADTEDLFDLDRLDETEGFGKDEFGTDQRVTDRGIADRGVTDEFGSASVVPDSSIQTAASSETGAAESGQNLFEEGLFTDDLFGDGFAPAQQTSEETAEREELLEESSPSESLLPEAEENDLDWLMEDPPQPTVVPPVPASVPSNTTAQDLFANSAFEQNLEEDLDLDSSFEEAIELSLDRMTDWFGDAADSESPSEESFLIDHLFSDLPDAVKKNDDWNAWEP
jgi:hypothetical protein